MRSFAPDAATGPNLSRHNYSSSADADGVRMRAHAQHGHDDDDDINMSRTTCAPQRQAHLHAGATTPVYMHAHVNDSVMSVDTAHVRANSGVGTPPWHVYPASRVSMQTREASYESTRIQPDDERVPHTTIMIYPASRVSAQTHGTLAHDGARVQPDVHVNNLYPASRLSVQTHDALTPAREGRHGLEQACATADIVFSSRSRCTSQGSNNGSSSSIYDR
jgi:hypothetical protein